jgi:hypothetical protein
MSVSRAEPSRLTSAIARVFDLSLGQMLWSQRTLFLGILTAAPVAVSLLVRLAALTNATVIVNGRRPAGAEVFGTIVWLVFIRFVVPVVGVFYGTALIADEVDDKTITYLFTRPIARRAVLLGKYLAYLVCTLSLVLPSVVLVYFLIVPTGGSSIAQEFPAFAADLATLSIGLATYGAVFAFVGVRVRRPLIAGLVFAFGWEPAMLLFPGYLKRVTVAYYLQALVRHEMPREGDLSALTQAFYEVPAVWPSLAALASIVVAALWLACRTVETREYVLEQ